MVCNKKCTVHSRRSKKEDNGGRKKEDRRRKEHNGERIGLGKYREEGEGKNELKKGDRGRGISRRGSRKRMLR